MDLPKRKHPRLKDYDYSLPGYYYVTIRLSDPTVKLSAVGRGLAPAEAVVHLTPTGKILELQLFELEKRYGFVMVDKYVIMPDHLHIIFRFSDIAAGGSQRPTLSDVVCSYKSLSTRVCNKLDATPGRKLFQSSFFEHVIRNEAGYLQCWNYINGNPGKWLDKQLSFPANNGEHYET